MKIICFCIAVFSAIPLVLGSEPKPIPYSILPEVNSTSVNSSSDVSQSVMGVCYFGRFPSARCMFRCFLKITNAYCDEKARCLCRSQEDKNFEDSLNSPEYNMNHTTSAVAEPPVIDSASEPVKNESALPSENRRVIFYIFDLNKIFGVSNDTGDSSSPSVSHILPKDSSRTFQEVWTMPHILAAAILALLLVLVLLEVMHFCKRRNSKKNFREAMIAPPVMDNKAFISDKA